MHSPFLKFNPDNYTARDEISQHKTEKRKFCQKKDSFFATVGNFSRHNKQRGEADARR